MGRRLAVAADLTVDDLAAIATGNRDEVAQRLQVSRTRLAALVASDHSTRDAILAARMELQAFLELRVSMMAVDALDTMDKAMREGFSDPKAATAGVRAAESILDRGALPKLTRSQPLQGGTKRDDRLPDLSELVKRAESNEDAHKVVDQYMQLLQGIEALRVGATELIEGECVEVQPETPVQSSHTNHGG